MHGGGGGGGGAVAVAMSYVVVGPLAPPDPQLQLRSALAAGSRCGICLCLLQFDVRWLHWH
jgi:hypothetical protein